MTATQVKRFVASRPDWALERFNKLAATNVMYTLTAYAWVRTTEHYMRTPNWEPSAEWLIALAALTSGAITQWVKKRTTDHDYQRIQRGQAGPPSGETVA